MKYIVVFLAFSCLAGSLHAQYVYTIKADSVKITNSCDTAELIIENHTQTVNGFLFNKGRGRTEFRKGAIKLNDTLYLIGADTLNTASALKGIRANNGVSSKNGTVVFGNDLGDSSAKLLSNRIIPMNGKHVIFSTPGKSIDVYGNSVVVNDSSTNSSAGIQGGLIYANNYTPTSMLSLYSERSPAVNNSSTWVGSNPFNQVTYYSPVGSAGKTYNVSYELDDNFAPSGNANHAYTGISIQPSYDFSNYSAGNQYRIVRGFYYNVFYLQGSYPNKHIAFENTSGDVYLNSGGGMTGIHNTTPTALLHVGPGGTAVSSAAMKLSSGNVLSSPETGAFEFASSRLAFTPAGTRKRFAFINDVTPSNGQIPIGDGADFTAGTLTSGPGINVVNASGSITISQKASVSVSAAGSLTLTSPNTDYIFTGSSATWTLPAISGNTGVRFFIKNRGLGSITLNSNTGGSDLYTTSAVSSITINPGDAYFLLNDGTYYSVK